MQGKKQFTDQVVTHFRLSERVPAHNFYRRLDALLDFGFLTDQLVTHFRLSERVPAHNFYRRLDALLDFGFLYEATRELYSHTGQPSLDPVVFFKLVLIGYLENITSDRRLLEHCAMRLDLLYFLGYELDEALPWH
uniref:transposase n=1 Tax=Hymenobacter crusticola TaxID=1770526 RepID=UPI001FE4E26A